MGPLCFGVVCPSIDILAVEINLMKKHGGPLIFEEVITSNKLSLFMSHAVMSADVSYLPSVL